MRSMKETERPFQRVLPVPVWGSHDSWLNEASASLSTRSRLVIARDLLRWLNTSHCMETAVSRNEGAGIIREAVAALVDSHTAPYDDKDDDCGICGNTGRFCSVCHHGPEENCQCPDFSHGRDCLYCRGFSGGRCGERDDLFAYDDVCP